MGAPARRRFLGAAVAAGVVLGARLVTPVHYGMHVPGTYLEFPDAEAAFLRSARERGVGVELLKPGEPTHWRANC